MGQNPSYRVRHLEWGLTGDGSREGRTGDR